MTNGGTASQVSRGSTNLAVPHPDGLSPFVTPACHPPRQSFREKSVRTSPCSASVRLLGKPTRCLDPSHYRVKRILHPLTNALSHAVSCRRRQSTVQCAHPLAPAKRHRWVLDLPSTRGHQRRRARPSAESKCYRTLPFRCASRSPAPMPCCGQSLTPSAHPPCRAPLLAGADTLDCERRASRLPASTHSVPPGPPEPRACAPRDPRVRPRERENRRPAAAPSTLPAKRSACTPEPSACVLSTSGGGVGVWGPLRGRSRHGRAWCMVVVVGERRWRVKRAVRE